ncbi:V-set and transmembrane domain-containing protein 4a [Engraulis encrasicolus]|uniref:V-set and transmembrane domain-containing protein 4a n=1 Tax=Engraulis encrasicolus TaxID=184585 RepID=UPI002FD73093
MVIFWLAIVLIKSLSSEALNVTVRPFPEVEGVWGEPVTIACEVGGHRGPSSIIVLRWVVRPDKEEEGEEQEEPPLTGPEQRQSTQDPPLIGQEQRQSPQQEFLLVKLNVRGAEFWGNYTHRFGPGHFTLRHDDPGHSYSLLLSNVTLEDRGLYSCRAQEVRKHRVRWKAIANATAHTLLRVHPVVNTTRADCIWRLFEDLYLCAAVLCSIGLVSILLFAMVITCQQLMRRTRPKDNYSLVKCPDSSSGETVTSEASSTSTSTSSGGRKDGVKVPLPLLSSRGMVKVPLPLMTTGGSSREMVKVPPRDVSGARVLSSARPHRKQKRHKQTPDPPDAPPVLPAKAPRIQKPRRTKLLKAQPRRTAVEAEDSLTYAELELVKAKPEPAAQQPTASSSGTVYAQIRF